MFNNMANICKLNKLMMRLELSFSLKKIIVHYWYYEWPKTVLRKMIKNQFLVTYCKFSNKHYYIIIRLTSVQTKFLAVVVTPYAFTKIQTTN